MNETPTIETVRGVKPGYWASEPERSCDNLVVRHREQDQWRDGGFGELRLTRWEWRPRQIVAYTRAEVQREIRRLAYSPIIDPDLHSNDQPGLSERLLPPIANDFVVSILVHNLPHQLVNYEGQKRTSKRGLPDISVGIPHQGARFRPMTRLP